MMKPTGRLTVVLTFLFIQVAIVVAVSNAAATSQRDALLAWKSSLGDPAALSTWSRATPTCSWRGVACNDGGAATTLRLRGLGLSGILDALDFAAFPSLTALDLNGNNLGGAIPSNISRLRALASLDLGSNGFTGTIPPQLGGLSGLVELLLYDNSLTGAIPASLSRLRALKALVLSSNMLEGTIPPQLGDLSSLVELILYNNSLTGAIPASLSRLHALNVLDLDRNRLTGELPGSWWDMQNLQFMDLSNNFFSGEIPAAPLNHNCSLESFHLAGNNFTGFFPSAIKGCSALATLDIGSNRFLGGIPVWIGSGALSLKFLSLRSNNFTGEIPLELSQLYKLQLLDLSNNRLSGSIPKEFGNLTSMKHPKVTSSQELTDGLNYQEGIDIIWKGRLIFQITVQLMTGIDFSSNSLSLCIPEELTNLQGLQFLNLSNNHLSCSIPENIGSLKYLEFLDLSQNELSGAIPPDMSNLLYLEMLNLSSNHLSGKIPTGNQLQTFTDPSIYSNNSGLCGYPLDIPCTNASLPSEMGIDEGFEDQWLYYSVIAGVVFGFWVSFGVLFFAVKLRSSFFFIVDGMQCMVVQMLQQIHQFLSKHKGDQIQ